MPTDKITVTISDKLVEAEDAVILLCQVLYKLLTQPVSK